jgi:molecular chaperone GrpE
MQPENEFDEDVTAEEDINGIEDIESLKESLIEARKEAEKNLENWQRTQADFINYKRRSQQEKEDLSQYANSVLLCNLLPVLDDLERALGSMPHDMAKIPWVEGIKLIEHKFHNILKSQGITPIKAKGKAFDPNLHEAAMSVKGKEGVVVKELLKGYRLCDRVIRPAKVAVGSGEE